MAAHFAPSAFMISLAIKELRDGVQHASLLYFPTGFASPPQGGDEISLRGKLQVKEVEYGSTKNSTDQDRTIGVA